ncbi:hypothetical protein QUB13_06070, partial [Microcoleus sp. B4-D4]
KKASQKQLSHFEIYQRIWLGLNQLGIFNPDSFDLPTEISPEVTYQYFSENSNYKIINLWSLIDEDRDFLEKSGLSLAHLELMGQDNPDLEEIYINSFNSGNNDLYFHKGKNFRNEIGIRMNRKAGTYFQDSIIETGYMYLPCPTTGQVLRSNQSFACHYPHPEIPLGNYPIFIYRFCCLEVFYLVCAVTPTGDKSFLYFPSRELAITFVPDSTCPVNQQKIINILKANLVSRWSLVKSYISSPKEKDVLAVLGYMANIGHYVLNDMSGLQHLLDNQTLSQIASFFIGDFEFFNIDDTYPEIQSQIIRSQSATLFETILENNYLAVWPTNWFISEDLSRRIYEGSVKRCSLNILQAIEDSKQHFPLIWIAIRSHYRVWLSQVEGIANIINKLYEDYPNLAVVFDGWGRHEMYDPRAESEIKRETTIVEEILALVHTDIKAYNLIGNMSYERVAWVQAIDFYISPFGSGLTFPILIANKPGVIHAHGVYAQMFQTGEWSPFIRENLTESIFLPADYTEDKHFGFANYDISWQKVYDATIKLLNSKAKLS